MNPSSRRGFTLVELLIVIAIIGTLVGLLLPAVNAARSRARQAQCLNNFKEIALATTNYATEQKSFPGWVQLQKLNPSLTDLDQYSGANGTVDPDIAITWAAKLLPRLDQQGLWEQLTDTGTMFNTSRLPAPPRLEIFVCPDDPGTDSEFPKLGYVANTGYFDLQPNQALDPSEVSDVKANGVMHDLRPGRNGQSVKHGSADVKDGANSTLLYSENIHKDEADSNNDPVTWLGNILPPSGSGPNYEQVYGMVWVYDQTNPNNPSAEPNETQAPLNRLVPDDTNTVYGPSGQYYARPASEHPEVFNVAFVGGNARSVAGTIEYRVYQQLMTPIGAKADALDYNNADERQIMQNFMRPPLSESDY